MPNQKNEQNVTAEEINVTVEETNAVSEKQSNSVVEATNIELEVEVTEENKENKNPEESTEDIDDFSIELGSFEDVNSETSSFSEEMEENEEVANTDAENIPESIPTFAHMSRNKKVAKVVNERMTVDYDYTPSEVVKWDELRRIKNSKRIKKALVVKTVTDGKIVAAYCLLKGFEQFPMLVPFDYLDVPYQLLTGATKSQKIDFINNLIGAQINVVIELLSPKIRQGIANRALANYIMRRKYFVRGFRRKNASRKSIVAPGTVIQDAQIIGVYERAIRVEIFGATTRIPVEELTHELITSCYQCYHIGERIAVKVTDIDFVNDDNCNVVLKASAKALLPDNSIIALNNAVPGEVCLATVVRFTYENGRVLCRSATGYNCLVRSVGDRIKELRPGSVVKIKLISKYEKQNLGIVDLLSVISL